MKEMTFTITSKNIIVIVSSLFVIYFVFIHWYLIWCLKKVKGLAQESEKKRSQTTILVKDLADHQQQVKVLLSIIVKLKEEIEKRDNEIVTLKTVIENLKKRQ